MRHLADGPPAEASAPSLRLEPPASAASPYAPILFIGGAMLAIAGLYLGQDIFVPVALACLFAFALTPIVRALRRLGFPRVISIIIGVLSAVLLVGAIGYLVATQVLELVGNLPVYQETVAEKLRGIRETDASGPVARAIDTLRSLTEEFAPPGSDASTALPVVVQKPGLNPFEMMMAWIGPIGAPLATAGLEIGRAHV